MNTRKITDKPGRSQTKTKNEKRQGALSDARKRASTGQLLLQCARAVTDETAKRTAETKGEALKLAHAAILLQLDFEGVRIADLAIRLGITKQAVSQSIGELVNDGAVELTPDPGDGRAKLVRLTKKGTDAATQELNVLAELEAELESKVGQKHMRALHAALLAIDEALAMET